MKKITAYIIFIFLIINCPSSAFADNEIERALIDLYNTRLGGSHNFGQPIIYDFPTSMAYNEALAGLALSVGSDIAVIVTLGKSEAAVHIIDNVKTAASLGLAAAKVLDGRPVDAAAGFASGAAIDFIIEQGEERLVGTRVPGIRTGVSVYMLYAEGRKQASEQASQAYELRTLIDQVISMDQEIMNIQNKLMYYPSGPEKMEYTGILNAIISRVVKLAVYRRIIQSHESSAASDYTSHVGAAIEKALGRPEGLTIQLSYNMRNALTSYLNGYVDIAWVREALVEDIQQRIISDLRLGAADPEIAADRILRNDFDRINILHNKMTRYSSSRDYLRPISDFQTLSSAIPASARRYVTLEPFDIENADTVIPRDIAKGVPDQGTRVPDWVQQEQQRRTEQPGTMRGNDGKEYKTVKIGNQIWMAENLRETRYRNGDAIPEVRDDWQWENLRTGARCSYENNVRHANTYGYLYNWFAVDDARNIAPPGWRVPTDEDWKKLEMALGMSRSEAEEEDERGSPVGSRLAGNASLWQAGSLKNHSEFGTSGFFALPVGGRSYDDGSFNGLGYYALFWSATEGSADCAWSRALAYLDSCVYRYFSLDKPNGFSLRLIRE